MNLTTKRFEKIINDVFGSGGDSRTSNCHYSYERRILSREGRYGKLTYVIQVYRNNELWKTFWLNNRGIDARILDNWSDLTERQRYAGTQKPLLKYDQVEQFQDKIKELSENLFN